jgi:hypothetical protein
MRRLLIFTVRTADDAGAGHHGQRLIRRTFVLLPLHISLSQPCCQVPTSTSQVILSLEQKNLDFWNYKSPIYA